MSEPHRKAETKRRLEREVAEVVGEAFFFFRKFGELGRVVRAWAIEADAKRKRKLLDKQKEGKKKMRQFGRVEIPQEAFIKALKIDSKTLSGCAAAGLSINFSGIQGEGRRHEN